MSPNTRVRFLASITSALTLGGAAVSQVPEGDDSLNFHFVDSTFWPAALGTPSPVQRMVAGDFTGDGVTDAVVLAGSQPALLYGVTIHTSWIGLPAPANDIDVARHAGPGGHDALAVVRDTGLVLVTIDAEGDISASGNLATSEWLGAQCVRCADVDASGTADFVGLGACSTRILVHKSGAAQPDLAFDCPEAVIDLAPLRWEANVFRIAALTSAGVRIFDLAGNAMEPLFANAFGDAISVLDGASRDRLAFLYRADGLPSVTVLKRGAAPDSPQALVLGAFGLSSADVDLDRADEVLVSHRGHHGAMFLRNGFPGSSPNLDVANNRILNGALEVPDGPMVLQTTLRGFAAPALEGPALFADLDGDRLADALLSVGHPQPSGGYSQQFPLLKYGLASLPNGLLVSGEFLSSMWAFTFDDLSLNPSQRRVVANVELDFRNAPWPEDANGLQVVVWRQNVLGGTLDQHAVANYVDATPESFEGLDVGVDFIDWSVAVGAPNAGCFDHIYWLEIRPVQLSSGAITHSFAARVCAIGGGSETIGPVSGIVPWNDDDQLPQHADHSAFPCTVGGGGSSTVITGVRRRRIPNFDPNTVPILPLPSASERVTAVTFPP